MLVIIIHEGSLHERATLMENRFKVRYNPILSYLEEKRQQCPSSAVNISEFALLLQGKVLQADQN